jgi:acyl-coenzyme A synthetase/AMP-(fatty) acid ligase
MTRSIVDYLAENARRTPDATLVYVKDRKISFRELEDATARCRGALGALGIQPGDRVALVMSDSPEMMIAMLGVMGMGAIVVPCSTMLKPAEIEYMLKDSGAKLVIVTPEHLENAKAAHAPKIIDDLNRLLESQRRPLGNFSAETPCLILYTSGGTGSPKGAVHLHDHLPETIERVAKVAYKLGPDDRIFSSSRLFFAYGLGNSFSFPIGTGCLCVLCSERPAPPSSPIFARHKPTIFSSLCPRCFAA